jgi:hypothetical protein
VIAIATRDPRYQTTSGVGVGASIGAVRALPGVRRSNGGQACQQGFDRPVHPGVAYTLRDGAVVRVSAYAFAD